MTADRSEGCMRLRRCSPQCGAELQGHALLRCTVALSLTLTTARRDSKEYYSYKHKNFTKKTVKTTR